MCYIYCISWFEDYVLHVIFNNFDIRLQNIFFVAITRLTLSSNAEKRKKVVIVLIVWVEMCTIVSWLLTSMMAVSSLRTYRPRFRSYFLIFMLNEIMWGVLCMIMMSHVFHKLGWIELLFFFQTMWNVIKYWRVKTNKEHGYRWASSNVLTYYFSSS